MAGDTITGRKPIGRAALAGLTLWMSLGSGALAYNEPDADDSSLAAQIAVAARELDATTPSPVDDITTLTAVRANGTDIIYKMAVSEDVPPAQVQSLQLAAQQANQTNLCASPAASNLIRMGATMSHHYTASNGTRFRTKVSSCPG